jgi:SAM-dependent methyltransferase
MLSRLRGTGVKARLLHPQDELLDRWLGVRTWGWRPPKGDEHDPHWQVEYVATGYAVLRRMLRRVALSPDDVFVDLGAGMGRATFVASWLGARRAVGVEIDAELVAIARANHAASRLAHRDVEFVHTGADQYPLDGATVLFMFNPFGSATMQRVVERLDESLARRPRALRVAYLHPMFPGLLDASSRLERLDHWDDGPRGPLSSWRKAGGWHATFWRSRGA